MTLNIIGQVYDNPTEAFETMYSNIMQYGVPYQDTKALFNIGFFITNPLENIIKTERRNFSRSYAEKERKWYLSGNPSGEEISKSAPMRKNYMDDNGNINSNYGYQRQRNGQLDYVISELRRDPSSRRAVISIYDGKEHEKYKKDTPCTCFIQFTVLEGVLCMTVCMRSNDLVFGFCNDQFQFSNLLNLVAEELGIGTGWYYHFATNIHIYEKHFTLNKNNETN